ncbi:MAG TPA: hypothetical protein VMR25_21275 [Planctomycetaceae bacterium]|jgi:hypothetical protein|nr:hypothetical protein [Planctomycetaceae bacterium]
MTPKKIGPVDSLTEIAGSTAACTEPRIEMLSVSQLRFHPSRPKQVCKRRRVEFDQFLLQVAVYGIREPLIVMADRRTVVGGQLHLRAARLLGFETVPCVVGGDLRNPADPEVIDLLLSCDKRGPGTPKQLNPSQTTI